MPVAVEGSSIRSITTGMFEPEVQSVKSRDVIDQLLVDHRKLESFFRAMRNKSADRTGLLHEFANLLIAHSEAEEKTFYPTVEKASGGQAAEERVEAEHTMGLVALLALMEERDVTSMVWDNKLTLLTQNLVTHIDDEEQTVHNKAREYLNVQQREELGDQFTLLRDQLLSQNIGSLENVRKMVAERATLMQKVTQKASELM